MNQKSLLCIVVLSIMLITANGLKIAHKQETGTDKFIAWVNSDPKLKEAFENKTKLSEEDADKVEGYFAKNPVMLEDQVYEGNQDFISCRNLLTPQLKKQFDQEFLDEMDFEEIFTNKTQKPLTQEQYQKILTSLALDQDFDSFFNCLNEKAPSTLE